MKTALIIFASALLITSSTLFAQDIPARAVPKPALQAFKASFPKAQDIEWEKEWDHYKVEFQIGFLGPDHELWLDKTGNIIKHKQEVSKKELPKAVRKSLDKDFADFRIDDAEKITQDNKVVYRFELKNWTEEWDAVIDESGKVLEKMADY